MAENDPLEVVQEHIAAFNSHSTQRLLEGFRDDAVWVTGTDVARGREGLAEMFDDWLWGLDPSLSVRTLVAHGQDVAAELTEELTVEGERRTMHIAAFFAVADGQLASVKVYREGSAEIL
jgi:ketosteroid isomerase-like protein